MCCLGSLSSSQPNKLRHILKFLSWYPIQHIFVPACSIARNSYKKMFLWTSNSKSAIFPKMYPSVSHRGDFRHWGTLLYKQHYTPVSHIGGILDTGVHDCPNSTLCNGHHFIPHYHRHLPAMNSLYRVSIMVAILQSNKSHQTKTFLCQKLNIKDSLRLKAGWRCTILARLLPFLILLFSGTWTNAKIVFF